MKTVSFDRIPEMFEGVGALFAEKKEELCAMDARLGDGDLGLTMSRGYGALPGLLRDAAPDAAGDIGALLMRAGMKMSSLVPSTMGFLMSSGIMEGGKALKGRTELDGTALADFLCGFAEGVRKRGKCELGQRTIYDAVKPAADAARACADRDPGASPQAVVSAALAAAGLGVRATEDMIPVFGKAAIHAAQCKGVADQGAVAGYYVILGLSGYLSA